MFYISDYEEVGKKELQGYHTLQTP